MNQPSPTLVLSGLPLVHPHVGVGTYTLRLIRGLAASGKIPFKVLLPRIAEKALPLLPEGCHVWVEGKAPLAHPVVSDLYWAHRIAATAIGDYPDAVFHSPGSFWSLLQPRRTVVTLHDCIYRHFTRYLGRLVIRKWLLFAMERYAARGTKILTVSEFSARDLHERAGIPAEKIAVLYNWIEDRFNPEAARAAAPRVRERYRLPESYWLYLGGYDYRKNVEFLIRAYAAAKREAVLPPLVLAGNIPADVSKPVCDVRGVMAETGLREGADVVLPGLIADEDLPGLYGGAGLFVYPSLFEGFGLPPAEAMAAGTPALAADNSSLPEVVQAAANRFPTDDPLPLVRLLLEAGRDPARFRHPLDEKFTERCGRQAYLDFLAREFGLGIS
jgi:glycosyltransferase involved in cell wall biosynthesis